MKKTSFLLFLPILLASCNQAGNNTSTIDLKGTWQLISATTITKGVSMVTDYTKNTQMIKIINDKHFAFLNTICIPKKILPTILMQVEELILYNVTNTRSIWIFTQIKNGNRKVSRFPSP